MARVNVDVAPITAWLPVAWRCTSLVPTPAAPLASRFGARRVATTVWLRHRLCTPSAEDCANDEHNPDFGVAFYKETAKKRAARG